MKPNASAFESYIYAKNIAYFVFLCNITPVSNQFFARIEAASFRPYALFAFVMEFTIARCMA